MSPGEQKELSKPTELIVVRHGETVWNQVGKQQGQLDTELSELGVAQGRALAEALSNDPVDVMYSSDLGRAMQTAQIISERIALDIITDARLRERHLGTMQGMTMRQFEREHPEEYAHFRGGEADSRLPGGESIRERYERSVACAEELAIRHPGQRLLIVAHGGVLNSFFRRAMGQDIASPRRFSLFNASINAFTITGGQWRLERWGDMHHLMHLGTQDDW